MPERPPPPPRPDRPLAPDFREGTRGRTAADEHGKHVNRFMAAVIASIVGVGIIAVVVRLWVEVGTTGVLIAGGMIAAPIMWGVVLWRLTERRPDA